MKPIVLLFPLLLVACSVSDPAAPTARRLDAPSFALSAPSGIAVDSVVGLTVYARWQDNSATNGGSYLVLSDSYDVQSTRKYQIVYGGDVTSGSITAYQGEGGCYLVSVFAWSVADADSPWATTGPVEVGGSCAAVAPVTAKRKGHK